MTKPAKILSLTLVSCIALTAAISCSGNNGGSGGGGAGLGSLGGAFSSMIPGKGGQYLQGGSNILASQTMGDKDEDDLGQTVAIAATNRWPLYDKPELTKYVTLVGLTVASQTSNPDGNWVFGVLDTPDLGAYSGPNGYIMVTRGAIAAMEDESELAGVLAHEIAHVMNRDGFNLVKAAKFKEGAMQVGSAANSTVAAFSQASDFLTDTVFATGWNRDQETKADSKAVQLLIASGYDPNGLTRFLKRMEQRKGGSAKLFSTHPGTADRIAKISAQIGSAKPGATNKERFTKAAAEAKL
jgi:beta-barrel assembly-enhancing protease